MDFYLELNCEAIWVTEILFSGFQIYKLRNNDFNWFQI